MVKDLRYWLKKIEQEIPDELVYVSKEVDPLAFEVTAVLHQMECQGRFEAVLFERVKDIKGKVIQFT